MLANVPDARKVKFTFPNKDLLSVRVFRPDDNANPSTFLTKLQYRVTRLYSEMQTTWTRLLVL
jgi:hypothetical protein